MTRPENSVMEAGNRGAVDAGGKSISLNIVLPHEQAPNEYATPELCFNFHYFATRKIHFLIRATAITVFPGGFGTLDELFETLTLVHSLARNSGAPSSTGKHWQTPAPSQPKTSNSSALPKQPRKPGDISKHSERANNRAARPTKPQIPNLPVYRPRNQAEGAGRARPAPWAGAFWQSSLGFLSCFPEGS